MDSFYASVEMKENPLFRDKPLVVGADPRNGKGRGVVSTASYEARKFGIVSGMPISKAFMLCPHAVFIRPRFDLYSRASARVMAILASVTDKWEQVSIDEAYLDVSHLGTYENARELALNLKKSILEREGLSCSIGIAPGKMVAKIASDFEKPDGLTIVEPSRVRDFLSPLPVGVIPGIGRITRTELETIGIYTIGQLAAFDIQILIERFGRWAIYIQGLAAGIDDEEVRPREGSRSISRESTYQEDTSDTSLLVRTLDVMAEDLIRSLEDEGLLFRTLTVKVRYENFTTYTKSKTIEKHSCSLDIVRNVSRALLCDFSVERKIRLIGLRLSNLRTIDPEQKRIDDFG